MCSPDQSGRVTSHTITDSDMGTLTKSYSYDALSRPVLIETDGGAEHIRYDAAGRIAEKTYPQTGRKKVYTYYENGMLKSLLTYREGELIGAESIEYDKNGNKTLWDQDGAVTRYTYDGMNRLQSVTDSAGVRTEYEFDGFGNISREYTLLSYGIESRGYEYDMNNRLLLAYDDNSSTRYNYDAAGNLTEKVYELAGQETKSHYGYDGYNRLTFFFSGNTTAEYTYNPEGLRESKTVNGSPTRFLYDGGDIVGELTADNYYLYYRGTELLASKAFSGKTAIYEQDSHGNITALLDYEGTDQKTYTYNAYGKEQTFIAPVGSQSILYQWKQETENGHNPFRYCGEYFDEETGLVYLRNRYYDSSIGRFISEDPIRDGLNWYVYCSGNPIVFVDPWGLKPTKEEAAAMAEHIYLDIPLSDPNDPAGNKRQRTVAGWRLIDVFDGGAVSSIKLGIYIPDEDDWTNPTEYALVYRGSTTSLDMETASVWANNILAYGSSYSVDMWAAIGAGMYFDATHSQEITFVGHSKGGGEAIAAATATGNDAITFNAANFNFGNYGLVERNKSGINNYYVKGEFLSALIGRSRYGTNHWLDTQYWMYEKTIWKFDIKIPAPIDNHGMKAVKEALN